MKMRDIRFDRIVLLKSTINVLFVFYLNAPILSNGKTIFTAFKYGVNHEMPSTLPDVTETAYFPKRIFDTYFLTIELAAVHVRTTWVLVENSVFVVSTRPDSRSSSPSHPRNRLQNDRLVIEMFFHDSLGSSPCLG